MKEEPRSESPSRQVSIKQRLILLIMVISVFSVLMTTIALTVIDVYNLKSNLIAELDVTARVVGERNQAFISFGDADRATENLKIFASKPSVVLACLYTEQGDVFAGYAASKKDAGVTLCPATMAKAKETKDGNVRVIKSLVSPNNLPLGYSMLESDLREIPSYISRQIITALAVIAAVSGLAYGLALQMQRSISTPILSLVGTAQRVSKQKDFSLRAQHDTSQGTLYNSEIETLIDAFNVMLNDIQERDQQVLRKNEELGKAKESAESANRAKSHFLANISHELRTPLNAVIGFSSILINQLFGSLGHEKYLEYARDINDAGVHLLDIINDILDLSKAEAGKLTLIFEQVYIDRAIGKCITIMSERAAQGGVVITTDIPKNLSPVIADRLRFIQIILNILSNAVKFTERGGTVHITARAESRGGMITDFVVTVQDTGIGMTKENIEKAFQSFGQIDSGLNRKYEGTGLGLPLTKRLMDLHYGNILIESVPAGGTTVTLHFISNPTYISDLVEVAAG